MISDDLNKFNWELTDRDQGHFEFKMMAFLWFSESVTPQERKTCAAGHPTKTGPDSSKNPRRKCESDTWKLPQTRDHGTRRRRLSLCAMRETTGLPKETFDIKWVSTGIRASVRQCTRWWLARFVTASFYLVGVISIGATWVLNRERFNSFASRVDVDLLQTLLDDA